MAYVFRNSSKNETRLQNYIRHQLKIEFASKTFTEPPPPSPHPVRVLHVLIDQLEKIHVIKVKVIRSERDYLSRVNTVKPWDI